MSEDVTTANLAQKDALGRIIQKANVVPRHIIVAPQQKAQNVMLKIGETTVLQPEDQPAAQNLFADGACQPVLTGMLL